MRFKILSAITIALISLLVPLTVAVYSGPGDFDLDGRDLLLDADQDTIIDSNTDDTIIITVGGTPIPSTILNTSASPTRFNYVRRSTSNQTSNNTTLSNIEIQFVGVANTTYYIQFNLYVEAVTQANKFAWGLPASATADAIFCAPTGNCSAFTEAANATSTNDGVHLISGFVVVGANAGTITLQFAQNVADAGNPNTLYANSTGFVTRIN